MVSIMRIVKEGQWSWFENLAPSALMRRAVHLALSGYVVIRSAPTIAASTLAGFLVVVSAYLYFSPDQPSPPQQAALHDTNKVVEQSSVTDTASQTVDTHDLTDWTDLKPAYRTYKIEINSDSSLQADKQAIELYGVKILARNQICKYRNGEKWACGQRAYVALVNVLGSKSADCRPHDTSRPSTLICQLAGTDIGEMMLREGWASLVNGVRDKDYISAAADAFKYKTGMWRVQPRRTASN